MTNTDTPTGPVTDQATADTGYAARLQTLEDQVSADLTEPVRLALVEAARRSTAAWVLAFGSTDAEPNDPETLARVLAVFTNALTGIPLPPVQARLLDTLRAGWSLGAGHTTDLITAHGDHPPTVRRVLPKGPIAAAANTHRLVFERLAKTVALATGASSYTDLASAFADSHVALSVIRGAVAYSVFQGSSTAVQATATAAGIGRVWVAERDACLHCVAHAGQVVGPGEDYPAGLTFAAGPSPFGAVPGPPRHPNCFPAGSVVSGPGVRATFKRWYDGEMVRVRVRSGHVLTGTQNHPVLTSDGWVALGLLVEGSHVVGDRGTERMLRRDPDDHQKPALIEQVAASVGVPLGVESESMPVTAVDFHGDGADGYVDVVRPARFLGDRAQICEHQHQGQLDRTDDVGLRFSRQGTARQFLDTASRSTDGGVRSLGEDETFALRGLAHAGVHGGAAISRRHAVLGEYTADGASGNPFGPGQGEFALAEVVALDEVVRVERFPFSGHVFNLETSAGWYVCNGIIVHNCRCTLSPWSPSWATGAGPGYPGVLRREAKRSVLQGRSLPSESRAARLSAAGKLLATPGALTRAPESVKRQARTAVRTGRFAPRP